MRDILTRLVGISGQKVRVEPDPSRRQRVDVPDLVGDHRKLTARTGWRPTVSFVQSLRDTLLWHRDLINKTALAR